MKFYHLLKSTPDTIPDGYASGIDPVLMDYFFSGFIVGIIVTLLGVALIKYFKR